MKKKVGIITWHYFPNFGSALQAYALQRTVWTLGYNAVILNYRDKKYGSCRETKLYLQSVLHGLASKANLLSVRFSYPFQHFQQVYLQQTRLVQNPDDLTAAIRDFHTIVCGSDQIWAPNVLNPVYLLNFVPDEIKKVSYAASIGLNAIPDSLVPQYRNTLRRFHAVSVRESAGADLIRDTCDISAKVVLDPTLLLGVDAWKTLEHPIKSLPKGRFVFCYFLKRDHDYASGVREFAQKEGLQVIGCSVNADDERWMTRRLKNIGPCEFLWLIHNADAVITDSYHGTIFSLLYHKPFITIERFLNSDGICQNSRIYQLRTYFDLGRQIIPQDEPDPWEIEDVDYLDFERKLQLLRSDSIHFLQNALRG